MLARRLISRYLLALCWVIAGPCPRMVAAGKAADLPGIYQGHAPAADAAKRVFTLTLASDGTATLTTLYIGKNSATQRGRWVQNERQIVFTFDAMGPNR